MIDADLISFSPLQREVIEAVVEGHDVFLQASTSFGKSLCFQLPAVISTGRESVPIHLGCDIELNR
jgi:superfamily II DNA helicase RecQ